MGENFEVDLATGSGSYRVPLSFPPGPRQIKPALSLGYSTGYGNGSLGLGWSLPLSAISRRGVDGQPAFDDDLDSFAYGGQRLIPVGGGRYRQEVEKDFYRVERAGKGWQVRSKDGTLLRYGTTPASRLELPVDGPDPVYQWLLESSEDGAGNRVDYHYLQEEGHARLDRIEYGPYRIHLRYETRPDPLVSHRLGVERALRWRVAAIELYLVEDNVEQPVKAYRLGYEQAPHSGVSRLVSVTLVAFDTNVDPPAEDALPPLQFTYTDIAPEQATLRPLHSRAGALPPPVADAGLAFVDVDGIGLPGFLHLSPSGGHYWPNLGDLEVGPARQLRHFPTALVERPDRVRVASLSGHGLLDLVVMSGQSGGYYALQPGGHWQTFRPFKRPPTVPILDSRTRLVDLDFDGRADLLYADDQAFYAVINRGGGDFAPPRVIPRLRDRARFPNVDLADARIHFAPMLGDGSAALVEIRDRSVIYWPNLGQGRFGPAVTMADPPDLPARYAPERIFLTDVDGDGLADLVYVAQDRVLCWFNRAGLGFGPRLVIPRTPPTGAASVTLVDLQGHGNQGLLWSGQRPLNGRGTHYFLDMTGPGKANLLHRIVTPNGAAIDIDYETSASEAVADRGSEEAAYLPFPVQVVRRVEAHDPHSGANLISEFAYHRGFYDRRQRRFLGFGRVERRDLGGPEAPDRITVTYFHTRPPEPATHEALQRHWVLARMPYRVEVYGGDDGASTPFWTETVEGEAVLVDTGPDGERIYFAARREVRRRTTDRGTRTLERVQRYQYDTFGNVTCEEESQSYLDSMDQARTPSQVTTTRYVDDGPGYLVGLPAQTVQRDGDGDLLAASRIYYDGLAFQGLPLGQATRGILARREAMVFGDDMLPGIYGAEVPDLAALGYFHVDDPELGPGWWQLELSQQADGAGNPLARRDPLGEEQRFEFDAHDIFPIRAENPLGHEAVAEYNYRHGQLLRVTAPDGTQTRWRYDAHGRLLDVLRPQDTTDGQPSLLYERAPFESPARLTIRRRPLAGSPDAEVQHLYFDARGQQLQSRIELEGGRVAVSDTTLAFVRGQKALQRGPYFAGSSTYNLGDAPPDAALARTRYDALDRPLAFEAPDGTPARRRYEAGVIHHYDAEDLDPAGPHADTPRSEYYDAAGRVVSVIEHLAGQPPQVTQYHYTGGGLLQQVVDHQGSTLLTRHYDLLGRLVRLDHREAGQHRYALDPAGHRVVEWRGGQALFRSFDALGRITALRYGSAAAPPVETYHYDSGGGDNLVGRLARVEGGFGRVDYSYTLSGKLKAKTRRFPDRPGETYSLRYSYDLQDRPIEVVYPDGRVVSLDHDRAGRPAGVSGAVTGVEYDASGYLTRLAFVNGVETRYSYTQRPGQVETLRTGLPGGDSYQHFRYHYDAVGNPVQVDDLTTVTGHVRDNRRYAYDALYRLVEAEGRDAGGVYHHTYGYDALGNLLNRPEVDGGLGLTYVDQRLSGSSAGESFSYDDAGNLTTLNDWTHDFDARGRLVESTHPDSSRVTTLYDHSGARVRLEVEQPDGSLERTWYCDDAYVINEDGSTETYLFFNRHPVAILRSDGDDFLFHHDPLGQPTCYSQLSDGAFGGQVIYYPYGGVALEMGFGSFSRYRFGNHPDVAGTGLAHFGARAYSPRLGRFMQPDPAVVHKPEGALRLPRGLHTYAYAMDNPAALIDPHGANWFSDAVDWVGDRLSDLGDAIADGARAVGEALVDAARAVGNFLADVGTAIWAGIKAAGAAIWEGIKWAAGMLWEGIKWLGKALAFLGTWALTILDFAITWLNPLNWIALGLDQIDHPVADVFSFVIKFGRAPLTTTIGLIVGGVGVLTGDVDNVTFKNGMVVFEWDPGASGFSGMVWGGVAHLWSGDANDPAFEHETYHSYQYVGWGDAFMPTYALAGGWGLLSSALAGDPQWTCFGGTSDNYTFGQPLEMGGELIDPSDNCH
jgi:RHS repeat-associated protein